METQPVQTQEQTQEKKEEVDLEELEQLFRNDYLAKHPEANNIFGEEDGAGFLELVTGELSKNPRAYKPQSETKNVGAGLRYGEVQYPRKSRSTPKAPWTQIEKIFTKLFDKSEGLDVVKEVYTDATYLFSRDCDTPFHDLGHIIETAVCAAQIYAGLEPVKQTEQGFKNAVMAGILHDMGYLRGLFEDDNEPEGSTGAAYTKTHVKRTMDWAEQYLEEKVEAQDRKEIIEAIQYTDLGFKETDENFVLGQVLMGADLISQMGAQDYVEKTQYLHDEFMEGGVSADLGQETVQDLWKGTKGFTEYVATPRIQQGLEALDNYFGRKNANPYRVNLQKNVEIIEKLGGEEAAKEEAA